MNESIVWNSTDANSSRYECHPGKYYGMLYFAFIPILQIFINVVVIVAVVNSRQKLRHNFVYVYVINTLAANLLFGLFSFYELLNLVLVFERNWNAKEPFQANHEVWLGWWAFRAGMIVGLFIAMSGSISALIYGIRESSYFIGRTAASVVKSNSNIHDRRKMWTIIFFNWLIPVVLCIACASGWSCVEYCACTPGFYGDGIYPCRSDIHSECSRIMNPLRKDFKLLSAVFWLLETLGIGFMITTTIRKYKAIVSSTGFKGQPTVSAIQSSKSDDLSANPSYIDVNENQPSSKQSLSDISVKDPKSCCINIPPLNHNIKLLIVMSVLFILFNLPVMCIVVIDAVSTEYVLNYLGVVMPYAICLLYSSISPLVLVYYMAGLRSALVRMFFRCSIFTRTIKVSNSISSRSN